MALPVPIKKKMVGYAIQASLLSCFFISLELIFHFLQGFELNFRLVYPVLFSVPLGFVLVAVFSLFPRTINTTLTIIAMTASTVWACVQTCYAHVFQTYMEVGKIFMAGDVADNFGNEMRDAILQNIPVLLFYILLLLVFSAELILKIRPRRKPAWLCLCGLLIAVMLHFGCYGLLYIEGSKAYSPIDLYTKNPCLLDNNMSNFGLNTSFRLDLTCYLFPRTSSGESSFDSENQDILNPNKPTGNPGTSTESGSDINPGTNTETGTDTEANINTESGSNTGTPPETTKDKNILDIDLDALIQAETNPSITAIHNYVNSQTGSSTNAYTGYFEGYNLIMICAESWSSYMISEELTPTLYKMTHNGFSFTNFYQTFKSVTTNGEFAFCTGLMPNTVGKTSELKNNSTFMLSTDKYMPYAMGNVFQSMGADTYAYHGNNGSFYHREETHPNLGYEFLRFRDSGWIHGVADTSKKLVFSTGRPTSDKELILQTMDDYLGNVDENGNVKPFHAYYMTYSGHHPYYDVDEDINAAKNPCVFMNRDIVDKIDASDRVQGYIAANLELENMVTELLKGLEEAGCLENTVIVLTGDHYPYGLTDAQFRELATLGGYSLNSAFSIYRNSFICYNAAMEEPVVVDTPCCTVDIIPTLLNLFGAEYDSRMLSGTDVLDDNSFHVAMLYNQSFITDKINYNTTNGKITYLVDSSEVSQEYIDACISYVKNKFEISLQIISNDYYRTIYDALSSQ